MSEEVQLHVLRKYELLVKMGSGAYGHVWKVKERATGKLLALKKVFDAFRNSTDANRTFREITILRMLRHPNVIRLLNVMKAENNKDLYLVFQLMECDLSFVICERRLQNRHRKYVAYQLFKALRYLHSGGVLHRDLKPSNLLINKDCILKICDFGLARTLQADDPSHPLTDEVATRWYRAPEVLLGARHYSYSADIWSVGCIFGQMLQGKPLFPGNSTLNQLQRIFGFLPFPSAQDLQSIQAPSIYSYLQTLQVDKIQSSTQWLAKVSPDAVDLLTRLLAFNPQKRITLEQALRHPYLQNYVGSEPLQTLTSPISIGIPEHKKLTTKGYRKLIYEQISKHYKTEQKQIRSSSAKSKASSKKNSKSQSKPLKQRSQSMHKWSWVQDRGQSKSPEAIVRSMLAKSNSVLLVNSRAEERRKSKAGSLLKKEKRNYMDLLKFLQKMK